MTVAIDMAPMDLDRDTASLARSDSDRSDTIKSSTTQPSSVDECDFPGPPTKKECTRVSPFAKYLKPEHEGVLELQDAVVTTLFNASPDMLMSFVDPTVGTFKAVFKTDKQLVIWRKGNAGFVGSPVWHVS